MRIAVIGRAATHSYEYPVEQDTMLAALDQHATQNSLSDHDSQRIEEYAWSAIRITPVTEGAEGLHRLDELITRIRSTVRGALVPILVEGADTPCVRALANQWPGRREIDLKRLYQQHGPSGESDVMVSLNRSKAPFEALLRWWTLYPDHVLEVSLAPELTSGCHWPLLTAWGVKPDAQREVLRSFEQRRWVEERVLVTRTRHCRQCRSVHLNYVDVCPRCREVDLKALDGLHCFACGHVDRMDRFVKAEQLSCPQCRTRLRHIGVDYDRPLESLACGKCDLWIVEGEVEAQCLDCGQSQQPGELIQHRIASLQLSAAGREAVAASEEVKVVASGLRMKSHELHNMLDILVPLARRHSHHHLLMVLSQHGESEQGLLERLALRIGSLLRDTDLFCQYSMRQWIFLLPHTPRARFTDVAQRIRSVMELEQSEGESGLSLDMHELPGEHQVGKAAEWLPELGGKPYRSPSEMA
ncbi:hypothetical protein [Cobetia sp. 5-11-6-3]|uniref:TackOD1 domain-containing metal-binding protein n=1 Tax=Cobetia sp. 5-11-6-3 TaxID=2737458 RepID=UPI00159706A2|nr:hypothetical protein [Cobetia sp. 5-11-6-3]